MRIQLKLFKQCKASDVDGRQPQNAPFRRMRLSSPGQTWRRLTERRTLVQTPHGKAHSATCASRKSTLCHLRLTEKHTLPPAPHQKAHSGLIDSRESALCDPQVAQSAPFRDVAAPGRCGATPRQAAGHYGEWLNWANALEQPPASLRGGLREGPQISVRSLASRKGALWPDRLTEKRILRVLAHA